MTLPSRYQPSDVAFEIECQPCDTEIRGNLIASGDDAFDKATEDKVIADSEWNLWAWCEVKVTAQWEGFSAATYLSGCSYESEDDFKAGGYWDDMKSEARTDLETHLKSVRAKVL